MFSDLNRQRKKPAKQDNPPEESTKRGKRSRDGYSQRSLWLPDELVRKAKAKLILEENEKDFSDLVAELLGTWVDK